MEKSKLSEIALELKAINESQVKIYNIIADEWKRAEDQLPAIEEDVPPEPPQAVAPKAKATPQPPKKKINAGFFHTAKPKPETIQDCNTHSCKHNNASTCKFPGGLKTCGGSS